MEREQVLALAGEPVAWNYELDSTAFRRLIGQGIERDTALYTADQVLAAIKPLEEEIELLKAEQIVMQTVEAGLRQQLAAAKFARRQAETDLSDCKNTLAAANAEIERLKAQQAGIYDISAENTKSFSQDFAAAQLQITQYREALQVAADVHALSHKVRNAAISALALPTDTTALSDLIAKAGEVMRERCADSTPHISCDATIRALPGVKLEDLK